MRVAKLCVVAVLNLLCAGVAMGGSNKAGLEFLTQNAKKDGVITLPSGLQYKVLNSGKGQYHPTVSSTCSCHYHGTFVDGNIFDSSVQRGRPSDFAPNQVLDSSGCRAGCR